MVDRVVFDCNVFVQALISPAGPAGECVRLANQGKLSLHYSQAILAEVRDVAQRPNLVKRFSITPEKVTSFIRYATRGAVFVEEIPHVFTFERDPKDEPYVDLAIATKSQLLVSRDKDLLSLRDSTSKEGSIVAELHPELEILTPVELLLRISPTG